MHLVPIIPQPIVGVEDTLEVKGIAAVKQARQVEARTLPPLLSHPHIERLQVPGEPALSEKRRPTQPAERRLVCRRIHHQSLLEELRSALDRRRRKGRTGDMLSHIDETA